MTTRSYQRLTVTIGIDAIARGVRHRARERRRNSGEQRPQAVPRDRADHLRRGDPLAADLDRGDAAVVRYHARERTRADLAAVRLDEGARRFRVHLVSGRVGRTSDAAVLSVPNISRSTRTKGAAAACAIG